MFKMFPDFTIFIKQTNNTDSVYNDDISHILNQGMFRTTLYAYFYLNLLYSLYS